MAESYFSSFCLGHFHPTADGASFLGVAGRKAIYGTLFGVLLLILIYFGSKLLLEGLH